MNEAAVKECISCGGEKPSTDFHSARNRPDGRYPYCKACCKKKLAKRAVVDPKGEDARKENKRAYDRQRYEANRDKIKARVAQRYSENADAVKRYIRDWQQDNAELVRAYKATCKHRRRAVTDTGISGAELLRWAEAQKKACYWCGVRCANSYHIDHYIPLSKGGKHETDNLVIACPTCNLRKHAKDPLDFAQEVGRLM